MYAHTLVDEYQVKTLRNLWDHCNPVDIGNFVWLKEVPIKATRFVWRVKMGRIRVAEPLSKRGIKSRGNDIPYISLSSANLLKQFGNGFLCGVAYRAQT
ncbi:hypothetical protein LXL04_035237 [Taraxacum kok-saghyz]